MGRRIIALLLFSMILLAPALATDTDPNQNPQTLPGGLGSPTIRNPNQPAPAMPSLQEMFNQQFQIRAAGTTGSATAGSSGSSPSYSANYYYNKETGQIINEDKSQDNDFEQLSQDYVDKITASGATPYKDSNGNIVWAHSDTSEWRQGATQFRKNMRTLTRTILNSDGTTKVETLTFEVDDKNKVVPDSNTGSTTTFNAEGDKTEEKSTIRYEKDGAGYVTDVTYEFLSDGTLSIVISEQQDGNSIIQSLSFNCRDEEPCTGSGYWERTCEAIPGCMDKVLNHKIRSADGDIFEYLGALNTWQVFGVLMEGYQQYKGLMFWTSYLPGFSREEIEARKKELAESFCVIGDLSHCFESSVCNQIVDRPASQEAVTTFDSQGNLVPGMSIKGYKVGPININGMPKWKLRDFFGNTTYIDGNWYDLSDPSLNPNTLPQTNLYFYFVQYAINNPTESRWFGPARDRKWNIKFDGERKAEWWPEQQKLEIGDFEGGTLEKYSTTDYDEVCLDVNPGYNRRSGGFTATSGFLRDKAERICDSLVSYGGDPTSLGKKKKGYKPPVNNQQPGAMV